VRAARSIPAAHHTDRRNREPRILNPLSACRFLPHASRMCPHAQRRLNAAVAALAILGFSLDKRSNVLQNVHIMC